MECNVKQIYVGNIPYSKSEEDVQSLFSNYGEVNSVQFINDRETGRFRGFGFVEMADGSCADEASQPRLLKMASFVDVQHEGLQSAICAYKIIRYKK